LTALIVDFCIIAIIVFCGWRGYRNGLIRGVFGFVTLIIALIVGNITAEVFTEDVSIVLKPFVGGLVDSALTDILEGKVELESVEYDNDTLDFRTSYTALRSIGLPESAALNTADKAVNSDIAGTLSDSVSNGLTAAFAYVAVFGIAFLLMAIIFAVVGNLISFVFSLPGLKLIDTIAGVAFGLARGFVIVLAIATVVRYVGLFALSKLESTVVLNFFVNHNLIANMLGI